MQCFDFDKIGFLNIKVFLHIFHQLPEGSVKASEAQSH